VSELRWHPLLDEWVAVAAHRQVRPIALGGKSDTTASCPFCPGGAEGINGPYEFLAFDNKFPSFGGGGGLSGAPVDGRLYRRMRGKGVCEVVLYSPKHGTTLAQESREHIHRLVEVWTDRYRELGARPDVKYVYIFENKGAVIGVTLDHPHGQIYAFPFVPPRVERELRAEARYMRRHRSCMLCDMVKAETRQGIRIVAKNASFVAYIPFFARYPYEVHIVSRRHLGHLGRMTPAERWALAGLLKTVLVKYDNLFGFSMPYIMLMHQAPTDGRAHRSHHFHIEFYPPHRTRDKIKYLAGCESGAGTFINDTIVEEKAAELRRTPPRGGR
jgi:UDPglucose--hexose-1-phosphate uridylyltransferase